MEQYGFSYSYTATAPAPQAAKAEARELLDGGGNRLNLILDFLLFIMMSVSVGTLTAVLWMPALPWLRDLPYYYNIYDISVIIDYILIFLFVLPTALGALRMAHRMCSGERAGLTDIFYPYRRLPRTWVVSLIIFLPFLIIAGIWRATPALLDNLKGAALFGGAILRFFVVLAAISLGAGALYLALRWFFFPGLAMREDMTVRQALFASYSASRGRMCEIIKFIFSFWGWAALSLVSFGVIFIIHLAPYYTVSYMVYCNRMTDKYI
ncbi:MAG: hypothetical protein GX057_02465 [Clostridiales bacterium]|nr:hypothetical protein [Clostridiales bacterium]